MLTKIQLEARDKAIEEQAEKEGYSIYRAKMLKTITIKGTRIGDIIHGANRRNRKPVR